MVAIVHLPRSRRNMSRRRECTAQDCLACPLGISKRPQVNPLRKLYEISIPCVRRCRVSTFLCDDIIHEPSELSNGVSSLTTPDRTLLHRFCWIPMAMTRPDRGPRMREDIPSPCPQGLTLLWKRWIYWYFRPWCRGNRGETYEGSFRTAQHNAFCTNTDSAVAVHVLGSCFTHLSYYSLLLKSG